MIRERTRLSMQPGRTSVNEGSALRRAHYLHYTQQTQETNVHPVSVTRTLNPSLQEAADLRLRPYDHRDSQTYCYISKFLKWKFPLLNILFSALSIILEGQEKNKL